MKFLLDFIFKIAAVSPTPQASTAYLKQVLIVVKPKGGVTPGIVSMATTMAQVLTKTNNTDAQYLFAGGLSRVYVLPIADLDLAEALIGEESKFFTILVSSDFDDDDIQTEAASLVKTSLTFTAKPTGPDGNDISIEFLNTALAGAEVVTVTDKKISVAMQGGTSTALQLKDAIDANPEAVALISTVITMGQTATVQPAFAETNLAGGAGLDTGSFKGVIGISSSDIEFLEAQAVVKNRVAFYSPDDQLAQNMMFAFGSLLGNPLTWGNQQYIALPVEGGVEDLGTAEALFDSKISFAITDDEYANRLALFAAGGEAIIAPYVKRNIEIDLQSKALQYVSANQPQYTVTQASLIEDELQKVIDQKYVAGQKLITAGTVEVTLEQDNFVASGRINIAKPTALWRILGEIRETL